MQHKSQPSGGILNLTRIFVMNSPVSKLTIALVVHCGLIAGCQSVEQRSPRLINPPSEFREINDIPRGSSSLVGQQLQDGVANNTPLAVDVTTECESMGNESTNETANHSRENMTGDVVHCWPLLVTLSVSMLIGMVITGGPGIFGYIAYRCWMAIGLTFVSACYLVRGPKQ